VGLCATPTDASSCSSSGRCGAFLAGQPFFYLRLDSLGGGLNARMGYFMQFDNQLADNSNSDTFRTNTHDAWIDSVSLEYTVQPTSFTPAFSIPKQNALTLPTLIAAGSNGTPFIDLIPPNIVALMDAAITPGDVVLVEIKVRGRGHLGDLSTFETGPITVPVEVHAASFPGYVCANPTDPVKKICPIEGEGGATFTCGTAAAPGTFTIGGSISGLTGAGLTLSTPGVSDLVVTAGSTSFQFGAGVPDGTPYNVTVSAQPAGQTCTVSSGSGTVAGGNVTTVTVTCI
jgi:hypothetical protein